MHISLVGEVASMPRKYDENTKARAVRLVVDHAEDYASEWEAVKTVSARLGYASGDAAQVATAGGGRCR